MSYEGPSERGVGLSLGLRQAVDDGQLALGGWCHVPSAFAAEIVSASGCDWLCVDLQHGLIDFEQMRVMVATASVRRTPVVVRVPWNEPSAIMRALDAGADGVIVPMINTAEEARQAVAAARFPPDGYRSWGPFRSSMATPGFDCALANAHIVCLVMIETVTAVQNLSSILAVPGVDGVYVGPNDLAISHAGSPARAGDSDLDANMIRTIAESCHASGAAAGIACRDVEHARRWRAMDYTLLGLPSDAVVLGRAMASMLGDLRVAAS